MRDGYYNSQIVFGFDKELDEADKKSQGNRKRKKSSEADEANTPSNFTPVLLSGSAQSLPERKSARKSPLSKS